MSYSIKFSPRFERELKRLVKKYPSAKSDIEIVLQALAEDPTTETSLGGNTYKIRFPIRSKKKGKSGGGRLITAVFTIDEYVLLIDVYDKSHKDSVKLDEIREIIGRYLADEP